MVDAKTYSQAFVAFTTFQFHGKNTIYYLRDEADLERAAAVFRKDHKHTKHRLFMFFLRMAQRMPLPSRHVFDVRRVQECGVLR